MKKFMTNARKSNNFSNRLKFNKLYSIKSLLFFVGIFVMAGLATLLITGAATAPNTKVAEAELSATNKSVGVVTDATASGGSYLEFKDASSGGMDHGTMIPLDQLPKGANGSSSLLIEQSPQQGSSGDGSGNFRTTCAYSHMSYDDPIVYPGQQGKAHLHTFFGNTSSNYLTTSANIRTAGNKSTCAGGSANLSSYWIPTLMNGTTPVAPDLGFVYYKSGYRSVPAGSINEVPQGLKMVAGNKNALTGQSPDIVAWYCEGGSDQTTISACAAGKTLQLSITFPQCWNGTALDSTDHISHLHWPGTSYASNLMPPGTIGDYGDGCSKETGFKTAIPVITINVNWIVPAGGSANLRLSSDLPNAQAGASAHGDFMEGWDRTIEPIFVQNCIQRVLDCTRGLGNGTALVDPSN